MGKIILKIAVILLVIVSYATAGDKYKCDITITNKAYKTCYSLEAKGPVRVTFKVLGDLVDKNNIKDRPKWKVADIPGIPKEDVVRLSDYKNSGFQIGHLVFDSAFDYNEKILKLLYVLGVNSVPEYPRFNMIYWRTLENHIRKSAKKFGILNVLYEIEYSEVQIGNHVLVPSSIYVMLRSGGGIECFDYPNRVSYNRENKIDNFRVMCH